MKKKFLLLFAALITFCCLADLNEKPVAAASYGRIGEVTPPARMRGKWYYKGSKLLGQNPNKIYRIKVGRHRINGIKLYQANLNVTEKYAKNYQKYRFVIDQTMNWGRASIFNINHTQWLNVTGWTAGAGNGTSYSLVEKMHHGKMVRALAIGIGYKPFIAAYAYRLPGYHAHHYKEPIKTDLN